MPKNNFLDNLKSMLGFKSEKPVHYERFRDGQGNFEIFFPSGWKYDENIIVVDGKYCISIGSQDHLSEFNISLDTQLPMNFNFHEYAKAELESPSSGIYTKMKEGHFRDMASYTRDYEYSSGGRKYFGGGVMFWTGRIVFSISWSGPEKKKDHLSAIFAHMLESLAVRETFAARSGLPGVEMLQLDQKKTKKRKKK